MNDTSPKQHGFSLVELMVALVAGLIVSIAVVSFAMSSMKSNAEYVQSSKLTQTLRNTMDIVVRDLRRAGYDDLAVARLTGTSVLPASPFGPVLIDNSNPAPTNGSCVIYAYDRPGGSSGVLDIGNGEVRGLRRVQYDHTIANGTTASVGVIEYATSFGTTKPTCGGAAADYTQFPPACNTTTGWCPLTDPSITNIRGFTLTETSSTEIGTNPTAVRIRNITVAMQARLVGDNATSYLGGVSSSYKRGLQATVKIRSDCVRAAISGCNSSP
jgi:prepilin-type N-terminal cleavage/methylation domain-containing protein